ncbi:MAG TPA: UdgX family uracil-DNA binding protein [Acidimicrobiia bacterium]
MSDPSELDLAGLSLSRIASLAEGCTACELYEDATQVVFGDGPQSASLMLLGEQPGDQEDRAGEPFVGPAGDLLDAALIEAGVDRGEVYITNAVKHFRFEEKGKRRLHKKPTHRHVSACRPWLEAELAKVGPEVIVTLGASAAQSILGRSVRVMSDHGASVEWEQYLVVPTIHPSFVLRSSGDRARRDELFAMLVADLKRATELTSG